MAGTEPMTGWLRGVLPLALAGVLAEGDRHGYALVQELAARASAPSAAARCTRCSAAWRPTGR